MKMLVTGGAGFIGSHFVRHWLNAHPQDEVVNLDLLTYSGVRATVEELAGHPQYHFINGDIRDRTMVQQAMAGCEVVVHFAAETHVDRSITDPTPFVRTNVEGTQVLLDCAVARKVRRFVHISTDEVYGPILEGAHAEEAPLRPRSPYAASKAAGDLLVHAYQETYGLSAVLVRPTNAFGPRQLPEKFIPLCVTNAMANQPVPIYGDGRQRRQWLFVEDLCCAIERVVEAGVPGAIYNVGSPWEYQNVDVARLVLALLDRQETLLERVADRPGHDRRYALQDAKMRALGWAPQVSFEEGLRRTVVWYREHPDWWQPLQERLRDDPYHWLNRPAGSGARQAAGVPH
ncbi:MAG: dTDP-glucose 4,6-dehydratase [Candidatus Omnitrophica bacterium]|nr:dTDP-glucose 4,6-dehydratase [Candidatus Omnitrophota bacterium]